MSTAKLTSHRKNKELPLTSLSFKVRVYMTKDLFGVTILNAFSTTLEAISGFFKRKDFSVKEQNCWLYVLPRSGRSSILSVVRENI